MSRTRAARFTFTAVRSEGGLLPHELLERVGALDRALPGLTPAAYYLAEHEPLGEAISRSWLRLLGCWRALRTAVDKLPAGDPAVRLTRERWLYPLFQELGFGRLTTTRSQPLEVDGRPFSISHVVGPVPIHLLGAGVDLDRASKGVEGATVPPHSLVQDLLNRSDAHRWALLSNGLRLRLLRDHHSLTRQAYVEFDLEAIFAGERFADFRLLWLCCHHSRVVPPDDAAGDPDACVLERWFKHVRDDGVRALDRLRDGVQAAILRLGNGFLQHPRNTALDDAFRTGALSSRDYYRQLLRLAYRLIFLFAAEDRNALLPKLPDDASASARAAQDRYRRFYATTHLRTLAQRRRGGPHGDRWQGLRLVLGRLHGGCPDLGLPALGSFLWSPEATPDLDRCELSNADLLAALHALCTFDDGHTRRAVSWQNIGADELGSVYEALLELHPEVHREAHIFKLEVAPGHERKTTGSYYTPSDLVECLLDTALDPVLDEAERARDPVAALLDLKICDPACGSGHFLLAAGRRLARRIAQVRAGVGEPSPTDYQHALREVVGRCLYGVDINEMAVELCKVSLWMEALEPGRPLSFLDHHIQRGNALLGTTPELFAQGLPEEAFTELTGDDPEVARRLRKRNRDERRGKAVGVQVTLGEAAEAAAVDTKALAHQAAVIDQSSDDDLAAVTAKERRYREFVGSPAYRDALFLADAWCAAFVWPKTAATETIAPTHALLQIVQRDPNKAPAGLRDKVADLAESYHFKHWHLAFPHVFAEGRGGFDVVLGNPPWEHVELKEEEFFAARAPDIASARNAAERKKAIAALKTSSPALFEEFQAAQRLADCEMHTIRASGHFPLCARGRINTYAIFAELNRQLINDHGRVGCILPSGIATDDTTSHFFRSLVRTRSLVSFYSFWEIRRFFRDTDSRQPFALLVMTGNRNGPPQATLAFDLRTVTQATTGESHFQLAAEDFDLLNPNTGTCPIFRLPRDAELTKAIHRRVPVLIREARNDVPEINPWGISFRQGIFNMASDSGLFRTREQLEEDGWRLVSTIFSRGEQSVPLYEAKMIHHFDHRFGTYEGQTEANAAQGKLPETTPEQHNDPNHWTLPRYWVLKAEVDERLADRWRHGWLLGWRDICRNSDARTVIASILPRFAVGHTTPLAFVGADYPGSAALISANLSSFVLDYVARQKVGGTHLTFGLLNQLPLLSPETYIARCPWSPTETLAEWLYPRVLELTYTAWDLTAFARDHGWDGPPFRWDEERRFLLRAELDAAFFHLYGIAADDAAYILDTFNLVRQRDEKQHGRYRTKDQILALHERMRQAMQGGPAYETPLDPPPADPSLTHPPLPPDDPLWQVIPQTRPAEPADPADAEPLAPGSSSRRTRTRAAAAGADSHPADKPRKGAEVDATRHLRTGAPASTTVELFPEESAPSSTRPSPRARKASPASPGTSAPRPTTPPDTPRANSPTSLPESTSTPGAPRDPTSASFQLAHPPAPQPRLFPRDEPAAKPASDPPPAAPDFRLRSPDGPAGHLFANPPSSQPTASPPPAGDPTPAAASGTPTADSPPDDDPPFLRHLIASGAPEFTPDHLAILRALHRAATPLTKQELLAATTLDEPRWTPTIRQLLEAGLVDKEGQKRGTRYRLAQT